ncbi:(2Fe-2S)-binding protein [Alphaproteobacteria bacterium]|nr:(2Fe-2S)-binding protein [Alphaproteobacteria bacterium]
MYICNCNAITEREVNEAIGAGATHWEDVHAHYDHKPCCGKCECEISEAIGEATQVARPQKLKKIQNCRLVQSSVDRAA